MEELNITFAPWFNDMVKDIRQKCYSGEIILTEEEFCDICAVMLPLAMRYEHSCTHDEMKRLMGYG